MGGCPAAGPRKPSYTRDAVAISPQASPTIAPWYETKHIPLAFFYCMTSQRGFDFLCSRDRAVELINTFDRDSQKLRCESLNAKFFGACGGQGLRRRLRRAQRPTLMVSMIPVSSKRPSPPRGLVTPHTPPNTPHESSGGQPTSVPTPPSRHIAGPAAGASEIRPKPAFCAG